MRGHDPSATRGIPKHARTTGSRRIMRHDQFLKYFDVVLHTWTLTPTSLSDRRWHDFAQSALGMNEPQRAARLRPIVDDELFPRAVSNQRLALRWADQLAF